MLREEKLKNIFKEKNSQLQKKDRIDLDHMIRDLLDILDKTGRYRRELTIG